MTFNAHPTLAAVESRISISGPYNVAAWQAARDVVWLILKDRVPSQQMEDLVGQDAYYTVIAQLRKEILSD